MRFSEIVKIAAMVALCAVFATGCKNGDTAESSSESEKTVESSSESEKIAESSSSSEAELLSRFVGDWQSSESFLESDEWYTGYLHLYADESGYYSIYDNEAGNPGICGHFTDLTENTVVLNDESGEDFDPPPKWDDMSLSQELEYKFVSDDELYLIYSDGENTWTLDFVRE